jgi:hypothetical protein
MSEQAQDNTQQQNDGQQQDTTILISLLEEQRNNFLNETVNLKFALTKANQKVAMLQAELESVNYPDLKGEDCKA